MKTDRVILVVCAVALGFCSAGSAKDKSKGKGKDTHVTVLVPKPAGKVVVQAPVPPRQPVVKGTVIFSGSERDIIHSYAKSCTVAEKGKKAKGLPPGLAKKVARGGELPPGWQKKCVRGQILSVEVFKHCHPLPHELVIKLPPPPPGVILVTIDGKVVRLAKASMEILDVFDVL
jgi:hypothetical protein